MPKEVAQRSREVGTEYTKLAAEADPESPKHGAWLHILDTNKWKRYNEPNDTWYECD